MNHRVLIYRIIQHVIVTYASSLLVERSQQITCLHPALSTGWLLYRTDQIPRLFPAFQVINYGALTLATVAIRKEMHVI